MTLSFENGEQWDDPDRKDLRAALQALGGPKGTFVICRRPEAGHFMQAMRTAENQFILEYQSGDLESHYRCEDDLTLSATVDTLDGYVQRDRCWRSSQTWNQVDLGGYHWDSLLWGTVCGLFGLGALLYWHGTPGSTEYLVLRPMIAVLFFLLAVDCIQSGRTSGPVIYRRDEPVVFWAYVGTHLLLGLLALLTPFI